MHMKYWIRRVRKETENILQKRETTHWYIKGIGRPCITWPKNIDNTMEKSQLIKDKWK